MIDIKLGQLIVGPALRDAIHIAVCPMTSASHLLPGTPVCLTGDGKCQSALLDKAIGVVDPFLKEPVSPGETFWLLLYPQTITGLRHEWSHPAFPVERDKDLIRASEQWLSNYARNCSTNYTDLMKGVDWFLKTGDYMEDDMNGYEVPDEFWVHYEIVTGRKPTVEQRNDGFWSCCV